MKVCHEFCNRPIAFLLQSTICQGHPFVGSIQLLSNRNRKLQLFPGKTGNSPSLARVVRSEFWTWCFFPRHSSPTIRNTEKNIFYKIHGKKDANIFFTSPGFIPTDTLLTATTLWLKGVPPKTLVKLLIRKMSSESCSLSTRNLSVATSSSSSLFWFISDLGTLLKSERKI